MRQVKPITVVIHGAMGRMGKEAVSFLCQQPEIKLIGAVDVNVNQKTLRLPDDSGRIPLTSDLEDLLACKRPMVLVDFSIPKATMSAVSVAAKNKVNLVIGTTGLKEDDLKEIDRLTKLNGIGAVYTPNFALGAILMMYLSSVAARYFDYAEIIELHHDMKVDAPSGTALNTARAMVQAKGKPFNRPPVEKGELLRSRGAQNSGISIHSVRLPGLLAHQEVILGTKGQTLTIRHDTTGRDCYMPGVLLAIKAVTGQKGLTVGLEPILGLEG
jgi:4-hydroxy-tetrahydrodipicolinate reductase